MKALKIIIVSVDIFVTSEVKKRLKRSPACVTSIAVMRILRPSSWVGIISLVRRGKGEYEANS